MRTQLIFRLMSTLLLTAVPSVAAAQQLPEAYSPAVVDSLVRTVFSNAYSLKQLEEKISQADAKVVQEKLHWLSSLRVGVQFINLPGSQTYDPQLGVIPALGASISLDLEGLATRPSRIRAAAAGRRIAEQELQHQKRQLRTWVEAKYIEYIQLVDVLKLRTEVLQAQEEQGVLVRARFQRGEATLEDQLKISTAITESREAILRTTMDAHRALRELLIAASVTEETPVKGTR